MSKTEYETKHFFIIEIMLTVMLVVFTFMSGFFMYSDSKNTARIDATNQRLDATWQKLMEQGERITVLMERNNKGVLN